MTGGLTYDVTFHIYLTLPESARRLVKQYSTISVSAALRRISRLPADLLWRCMSSECPLTEVILASVLLLCGARLHFLAQGELAFAVATLSRMADIEVWDNAMILIGGGHWIALLLRSNALRTIFGLLTATQYFFLFFAFVSFASAPTILHIIFGVLGVGSAISYVRVRCNGV